MTGTCLLSLTLTHQQISAIKDLNITMILDTLQVVLSTVQPHHRRQTFYDDNSSQISVDWPIEQGIPIRASMSWSCLNRRVAPSAVFGLQSPFWNVTLTTSPTISLTLMGESIRVKNKQEVHHKRELGKTPCRSIRKRCRYSSLEKSQDAFDTALDWMQTKPSATAFSAVFRTSINTDRKQLVTLYSVWL